MGRPKKYNREAVLHEAMRVFWRRGFADTALQDLEKATGVNKSGLYAEFKDKDDIFIASLKYYYDNRGSGELLTREPLGWHNIESFLRLVAEDWSGKRGCFSSNSMRELEILPTQACEMIESRRVQLRKVFERNIAAEQTLTPPKELAEITATFYLGLNLEQNLNTSKASTLKKIDSFMRLVRSM